MLLDLLHAGAIVSTALGGCGAALQRSGRTARVRDLTMAVGMLAAMLGAAATGPGLALAWTTALVVIGLGMLPLAARATAGERAMVALDAFAAVVMGALILVMGVGVGAGGGHHGPAPAALAAALGAAAIGCGIAGLVRARRDPGRIGRLRALTTAASVLLMAGAAVGGAVV